MNDREQFKQMYEGYKFDIQYPVLDVGGGDGSFLEHVGVTEATIIDITNNRNPKFDYIKADISKKLPEINKKFSTIFVTEVLEHLRNPLYLMAQVFDLLDDDGDCFISIPYTVLNKRSHSCGDWDLGHVSRWKMKEFITQMNKIGFSAEVIHARRRFKNMAFFLPHCWIFLKLRKAVNNKRIKNNLTLISSNIRLMIEIGNTKEVKRLQKELAKLKTKTTRWKNE